MSGAALFALACAGQLAFTVTLLRRSDPVTWWRAGTVVSAGVSLAVAAGFCGGTLILLARDWWNRKGRRAAKALGEKGRAVVARLAERAREALEPVPQGVRA